MSPSLVILIANEEVFGIAANAKIETLRSAEGIDTGFFDLPKDHQGEGRNLFGHPWNTPISKIENKAVL